MPNATDELREQIIRLHISDEKYADTVPIVVRPNDVVKLIETHTHQAVVEAHERGYLDAVMPALELVRQEAYKKGYADGSIAALKS